MPGFTLTTTAAKLSSGFGESDVFSENGWRITLTMQMDRWDNDLTLETGEDQSDLQIYLNFMRVEGGKPGVLENGGEKWAKAIGLLRYHPAWSNWSGPDRPPTMIFDTYLAEAKIGEMLALARLGRFPSSVTVWLPDDAGIRHGDGFASGLIWDNKANPLVPIESVDFEVPISEPEQESVPPPDPAQPKTDVGADLLPELRNVSRLLGYVLGAIAFIAAFIIVTVLFRR
jgi:hypothetical protein